MEQILLVMLLSVHSFYSHECCTNKDCYEVSCKEVIPNGDGWKWKGVTFKRSMLRSAPDGGCHVCIATGPLCIYLPPQA
jgi:hypothetical protein